ncbi:MAG TPA: hypothetical protein VGH28_27155 [Polyangiaceae bacterium]
MSDGGAGPDDAGLDVGSCEGGACGAPDGFQPVLFAADRNTACTGALDVVVDPGPPSAGACTCSCTPKAGACLPQAQLVGSVGLAGCSMVTTIPVALDGGCNEGTNGEPPSHAAFGPFPSTGASCSSSLQATGTIASTPGRVCPVTSCSACAPPTGFELCFAADGAVACPSGMTKHVVGSSAELACSPCTDCSVTSTCGGTLKIYDDKSCLSLTDTITVDGTCHTVQNDILGGFRYTPAANQPTCVAGTSTASVSVAAQTTVCCSP